MEARDHYRTVLCDRWPPNWCQTWGAMSLTKCAIVIQILWRIQFIFTQILIHWSVQMFAHTMLSWHVQIYTVISLQAIGLQQKLKSHQIWITSEKSSVKLAPTLQALCYTTLSPKPLSNPDTIHLNKHNIFEPTFNHMASHWDMNRIYIVNG